MVVSEKCLHLHLIRRNVYQRNHTRCRIVGGSGNVVPPVGTDTWSVMGEEYSGGVVGKGEKGGWKKLWLSQIKRGYTIRLVWPQSCWLARNKDQRPGKYCNPVMFAWFFLCLKVSMCAIFLWIAKSEKPVKLLWTAPHMRSFNWPL